MFVLARALTYAVLFVGLVLIVLPWCLLSGSGIARPDTMGPLQVLGLAAAVVGGVLALWCVLTFTFVGRGTPAPFDPPRRLVIAGPYRCVRNPMYLGAILALTGAAGFYESVALLAYACVFSVAIHTFVVWYEEPTLARLFGEGYLAYRSSVGRWVPRFGRRPLPPH